MNKNTRSLFSRINIERLNVYLYRCLAVALPIAALLSVTFIGGDVAYNRVNAAVDSPVVGYSRVDANDGAVAGLSRLASTETGVDGYARTYVADNAITDLARLNEVSDVVSAFERTEAVNDAITDFTSTDSDTNAEVGLTDAITNVVISFDR